MKKHEETDSKEKEEVKPIAPLTNDFGREDLNELRDKINEIIARS